MFKSIEKRRPVQYCAGMIASIGEPKIAQNGKSYLTFKIEGVGASPKANLTVFFRPEWFMKDFNPSKLPAEEKLDYSRLVANTFRSPFLLPILQVILGDEGYKEFSRLCHERAQVTEEGIQEDLFEAIRKAGTQVFGYILVPQMERITETDENGEERVIWRQTKFNTIRDPRYKTEPEKRWSGVFRITDQSLETIAKAASNPAFAVSHITQEVAA
jgi:hypothetical protein